MTSISNVDQVLTLLRQQLQRTGKSDQARKTGKTRNKDAETRKPAADRIEEISRSASLSDEELARNLVAAMLIDEFGEGVANDHRFQRLAGDVYRIIAADPDVRELLRSALKHIKKDAEQP